MHGSQFVGFECIDDHPGYRDERCRRRHLEHRQTQRIARTEHAGGHIAERGAGVDGKGLGTLLDNVPQFNPTAGTAAIERPELALATLLAITPVLIVFLFSQRFLVAGMLAGATKD